MPPVGPLTLHPEPFTSQARPQMSIPTGPAVTATLPDASAGHPGLQCAITRCQLQNAHRSRDALDADLTQGRRLAESLPVVPGRAQWLGPDPPGPHRRCGPTKPTSCICPPGPRAPGTGGSVAGLGVRGKGRLGWVSRAQASDPPGPGVLWPPQVPGADSWLLGEPGDTPAWAGSLQTELSEQQRLQISKELVDLQITTHRLQEQHEAEVFQLQREVLRLERRVLELELYRDHASHRAPADSHQGCCPIPAQEFSHRTQEHQRPQVTVSTWRAGCGVPPPGVGGHLREDGTRAQQALRERVAALDRQLQGTQEEARAAGQQLAAQAMVLSTCQAQLRQAEADNARLQLQLKRLMEEYAARLQHCTQQAVEQARGTGQASLRTFLEATLEDIRAAHRSREQQLAQAARTYRKRLADLSRRHELLLTTCSVQQERPQAPTDPSKALETPGATCAAEPGHPRDDKCRSLGGSLLCPEKGPGEGSQGTSRPLGLATVSWAEIHQKLRDFSRNTQAELERQQAQLLVRATVAEEQLAELQEYVDQHLGRYKQEILRLRTLVGSEDLRNGEAPPPARPRHPSTRSTR
ncbi:PREDICTED: coiled-coil domain-containing protein 78 [Dipodomys ordii]|uniref:Coiled-coil domain-containing protein 78 n=1 Tax=Dipodomys ordii TaxID=10020 RepID=A0A1S3ES49_DIPOR|nr:PREDICTED: coiled-coil domain-containing protein 78 [Dipodomys ordii]